MPPARAVLDALPLAAAVLKRRGAVGAAPLWTPLPGPQTLALESEADEVYYGGQAGGGKSDLLLGLALTRHRRAVIFRREYRELLALVERSRELIGEHGRFNGTELVWRFPDGRLLEFGAVQHPDDVRKWRGRDHDLVAFDEGSEFTEAQYLFLTGWARTTAPGQRVRIVVASNPPSSGEGEWVIRRWAAWLDGRHPDPAEPGELRWYVRAGDADLEVGGPEPVEHDGETLIPTSRTFIPARLDDNPHLAGGTYRARLQGLPEPLRSQLLYGDFTVGLQEDPWQVLPTAWVRAAQERWRPDRPTGKDGRPLALTRIGVDVAQGGADRTVLARRYGYWFAPLEVHPGGSTPDVNVNATLVLKALAESPTAHAVIDADGIGAAAYYLVQARAPGRPVAFRGSGSAAGVTDKSGLLRFANYRAVAWWALREWLDPANGHAIELPPGRELLAELCATRYRTQTNGIQLEPKEEIKARLGRSPDLADAVVCACIGVPDLRPVRFAFGG